MPRFLPPTALALTVFSATVAGAGAVADQQAPPSFRSSATQVAVTAAVRQPNGAPVTNLTRDDFEILDNGQLRAISTFWSEPSAASVALLVAARASSFEALALLLTLTGALGCCVYTATGRAVSAVAGRWAARRRTRGGSPARRPRAHGAAR